MSVFTKYEAAIAQKLIKDDPAQRALLPELQRILDELAKWYNFRKKISGIYIYGPIGIGKTFLLDLFYQQVKVPKARFHYHKFMQYIDAKLRELQGQVNPLEVIAKQISKKVKILCLDEFLVNQIADAMILGELLSSLFKEKIILVTTSNVAPDFLYENGLNRQRFLPAIALIKTHCHVYQLIQDLDYRFGRLHLTKTYFTPLTIQNMEDFKQQFILVAGEILDLTVLTIQDRPILVKKCGECAVWFNFSEICAIPRCTSDYLELVKRFKIIFVSDIPQLKPDESAAVTLLINFIDVLYDYKIKLIVSAASEISGIYSEGPLLKTFQRALSRLDEMQSVGYGVDIHSI